MLFLVLIPESCFCYASAADSSDEEEELPCRLDPSIVEYLEAPEPMLALVLVLEEEPAI